MKTIIKSALILISSALILQDVFADEFRFDYDYCVFRNDDQKLFLELYYAFSQQELLFVKSENGFEAAGELDISVLDKNRNKTIIQKMFKVPVIVRDTSGYDRSTNLTGQVNFLLDSGEYAFRIKASDFNNPSDSSYHEDNLDLKRFPQNSVTLSCIEMSTKIQKSSDKSSVFYKNTLEVVPNPNRLFGNNLSTLYYYFELYNLNKENISEDYFVVCEVTDLNNNKFKSEEKKYLVKNEAKVEYGSFDISDLPTNSYNLVVRVIDDKNKESAKNVKKFFVYNSDTSKISFDKYKDNYLISEYVNYSEDKLDQEFNRSLYISTDVEREQYEDLKNIDAKRKFMYEFWKRRDITPATPVNEFKDEYLGRVKYANSHFKYSFTEGWRTDRGRVYIVYGKPDEINRFPFEADKRAYEIWKYNAVEGGVEFVFVDLGNATGNYGLVHSTARNELRNDNWPERLIIK